MKDQLLKVALAQIAPIWLDKLGTISKIETTIEDASKEGAELIVFGESLLPGYPFWVSITDGAQFNSQVQKEIHAHYAEQAIIVEHGDLNGICKLAKEYQIAILSLIHI